MKKPPYKKKLGDCFEVAFNLSQEEPEAPEIEIHLVHGLPIGTGTLNEGRRYWHAWVEQRRIVEFPVEGGTRSVLLETVLDKANGHDAIIPKAWYYKMGQIEEEYVWRYTPKEAAMMALQIKQYGPWVSSGGVAIDGDVISQ